ncbi:hybrid sensor histidine kinase/response regulator [Hydrocarboniphaga sp.]|uniref:hybrid sensor histidine kinase/response regulator n=1 Tax=Hydrocarboniphaga sp. TaxID=2033016 RepID=UPI003D0C8D76
MILAPTGRDSRLMRELLAEHGIASEIRADFTELSLACSVGVAGVLLAEEAIRDGNLQIFGAWVRAQPAWSDLPVLVLTRQGADSPAVAQALDTLGNVTLLERPTRMSALTSAARAALRARARQYQVRDQLLELQRSAEALRASEERLLDADRRKDEFLATLAHELRNPLAPIRNALHLLRLGGGEVSADGEGIHLHQMMERQVNHMVRLVDDLLEISRITRGNIELQLAPLSIATLINSAIETSRPIIESAGHRLEVKLPAQPLQVEGDSVRLAQVLSNLLNNAAKYTDAGGLIEVIARADNREVVIQVCDSGVGIPPDMLPRVFDMFTQVHDTSSRSQGGLGIGLTLVRSLAEMHGGRVSASSEGTNRGSCFTLHLPQLAVAAAAPSPVDAAAAAPSSEVRAPHRILVVDDNADAADSLGMVLQVLGAEVLVVHGGQAALDALQDYKPDVAFVDIGMPDIDGFEVARRVRARGDCADLRLIALTGWGQQEDRRRSAEAGFDRHLVKPAGLEALKVVLESL